MATITGRSKTATTAQVARNYIEAISERDLDTADPDAGAIAELHLGATEALLAIFHEADDGRVRVDRKS